jgi:hypothetical protein
VLDIGFGEDLSRKRAGHSAQNFSLLNRIALNMLKQEKTSKRGIRGNASVPPGTIPTYLKYSESDMRRPCRAHQSRRKEFTSLTRARKGLFTKVNTIVSISNTVLTC